MTVTDNQRDCHSLTAIRAGFVSKGTSLHAWCQQNKVDTTNARKAIKGTWNGPKAKLVLAQIYAAAGITAK